LTNIDLRIEPFVSSLNSSDANFQLEFAVSQISLCIDCDIDRNKFTARICC